MDWLMKNLTLTPAQRRVIGVLLVLVAGYAVYQLVTRRAFVPEIQADFAERSAQLADQIDPNEADWQTLAVLPAIGEKRAKDIVARREELRAANPGLPAYTSIDDLDRQVRGIGPVTVIKLQPYLRFPTTRPKPQTSPD